ncbi:uncharacterized protein EI90DRAFT_1019614 [Cantharellus anzutake]|uniref:uncharacterized protein n=1 Tax=Cantharellus anzutake TaxID=1750568 RepID=UPI0019048EAE|nr:uncharacterized protein EI90DRAFT_1019614 [Cantharellus anzutake]KAF8331420.1 hypothetical protein EI90DRAFT_1019614 [Cantharellus anzutake]
MEVDSTVKRSASSGETRSGLSLHDDQLEIVTVAIEGFRTYWATFLNQVGGDGDDKTWISLFPAVLSVFLLALQAAGLEDIQSATPEDSILHTFSDVERGECKDLVIKALNDGDSTSLIEYLGPRVRRCDTSQSGLAKDENLTSRQLPPQEYVGSSQSLLLDTLDRYSSRGFRPYHLSMTILQSSGCGKSRLVDKSAEERFAFPLNTGEPLQNSLETYPLADQDVREFFLPQATDTNESLYIKYTSFLIQMFRCATPIVRSFKLMAHSEIAKRWHKYLAQGQNFLETGLNRREFYRDVISQAEDLIASVSRPNIHSIAGVAPVEPPFPNLQAQLADAIKCLELVLYPDPKGPPSERDDLDRCSFFLYIDGARSLTEEPETGSNARNQSAHDAFTHVLSWVNNLPFFTLFLSTSVKLRSSAATTMAPHPSTRVSGKTELLPEYTVLPFDIFSRGHWQRAGHERGDPSPPITLKMVCSSGTMVCFGRPLWYSMYDNGKESTESIFAFAMKKLGAGGIRAGRNEDKTRDGTDTSAMLASLDIRLQLSFDLARHAARSKISTLVESYMRVVYAVPLHREFIYSGYPSEPVLVEAAARLLNQGGGSDSGSFLPPIAFKGPNILKAGYREGILDCGEHAEAVGRLLVTIAHDAAIMCHNPSYGFDPVFHKPVKVLDFLRCLFHPSYHQIIFSALPVVAGEGAMSLERAYENAYISFSHFVQAGDSKVVRVEYLSKLLLRGGALNCYVERSSIDLSFVIPVFFGGLEQPIDRGKTSALQVQIRNHKNRLPEDEYYSVNPQITKPDLDVAVLSLILEFGAQTSLVGVQSYPHRRAPSGERLPDEHHYLIVAHGCSSATYSVIPAELDKKYASLLRHSACWISSPGRSIFARPCTETTFLG